MDCDEQKISNLELEIQKLRTELDKKENELLLLKKNLLLNPYCHELTKEEICRYSRQMIMPELTINGQIILKRSKVLIAGTGGLGCPAALYLVAAGIGNITIVDEDCVEMSNLHRQVLHTESNVGKPKTQSARETLKRLNSSINITPLQMHINSSNISNILDEFDVVIDGTDNVATRYLLNDVCVLKNKPLISGSALQFEGQLTVYNYRKGPCYRCLYPIPPPPETVTSCGDGGVLGVVPGVIGVLQALETIKLLIGLPDVLSERLLLFDGSNTTFRNVKLRKRNPKCVVCGDDPVVKELIDYEQFCDAQSHDRGNMINMLPLSERITIHEFNNLKNKTDYLLVDVRSATEFGMCHLPNSMNIPLSEINKEVYLSQIKSVLKSKDFVLVVCRRGNDSQRAVLILQEKFRDLLCTFKDIIGGLHAYSTQIDSNFPVY